jgi:hypothetical protein
MRLFGARAGRALALGVSVCLAAAGGAAEPAATSAARRTAAGKAAVKKPSARRPAAKKAPRPKKTPRKKKVVGLDLPPLPRGRTCYRAGAEVPEPPVLKSAEIKLPEKAKGGPLKSALLVYEVTIDKSGRISEVKTLGKRPPEPPWPQLHDAAIEALKRYKYAKTVVRGASAPVCLMVSLNVDLR